MSNSILIIDDDKRLRELLEDYLLEKKFVVYLSDDFRSASSIANYLKINFYPIFKSSKSVIYNLKNVLNLVQDWRDFNVHCAIVNLFIAENLRTKFDPEKTIILTGDLMNEFVCDYREETVGKNNFFIYHNQI